MQMHDLLPLQCLIYSVLVAKCPNPAPVKKNDLISNKNNLITKIKAEASNKQTKALASVIFWVFVVFSKHKHPKYLGRKFNHGTCLSRIFFLATELKINFAIALYRKASKNVTMRCGYARSSICCWGS